MSLWGTEIFLCENYKIVNNTQEVTEHFITFFSTVANNIGSDLSYDRSSHPNIIQKRNHNNEERTFQFVKTTEEKPKNWSTKLTSKGYRS